MQLVRGLVIAQLTLRRRKYLQFTTQPALSQFKSPKFVDQHILCSKETLTDALKLEKFR